MTNADYKQMTVEEGIAALDDNITQACLARDMAGAYRALVARRALEAGGKVAVALIATAALAFAGIAQAATGVIAKADKVVKAETQTMIADGLMLRPTTPYLRITVACREPRALVVACTVTQGRTKWNQTFDVVHGKLVDLSGGLQEAAP